jgi:hypothetical protein
MKVLEEIVAYLHDSGALTGAEVEAFERSGFIRPRFNHGDEREDPWRDHDLWGPDPQEMAFPDVASPPPVAGRARVRGVDVNAGVLASRVNAFFRDHDGPIGALARMGGLSDAGTRWARIASIARADPAATATALAASIDAGTSSFHGLWSAIGLDGHLSLLLENEHGAAPSAYRALVRAREPRDLGKYLWLLRRRAFVHLHDFLVAQRRVAAAFLVLARERPELLGKWLSRDYHPLGYWTLVLLHNAGRRAAGAPWEVLRAERPVRRMLPEARALSTAWTLALDLGEASARSFLVAFWEAEIVSRRVWASLAYAERPERYSEAWAEHAVATEARISHVDFYQRAIAGMRGAACLDAAPGRAFLERHWSTGHAPIPAVGAVEMPLPSHPNVTLFCPSGWD